MKAEITSLDLHFLARELDILVGAKVDKVYEQEADKKEFLFLFHKTGSGKMMLRIKLPSLAYITSKKQVFPESPPGFCTFLRKHLGNARVATVRQKDFERILEIEFETKEGKRTLICELFSKGNMILVDEGMKIKGLLESQNWQARTIRGGTAYEYPPSQANTPELNEDEFLKIVKDSKRDSIVKALAVDLGLGGIYSEELCERADVKKNELKISEDKIRKLYSELKKIFGEEGRANRSGEEIFPIELETRKPEEKFESFNLALDTVLSPKIVNLTEAKVAKENKTKRDKIMLVIKKQEERLAELEGSILESQRKGELIYEHYSEVKELLEKINLDRKKMSWEELKKKYEDHKLIKEIDESKGKVVIELE